jgi:hypothetical protein
MITLMNSQITSITPRERHTPGANQRSWLAAYGRFLLSPQESLILKIAPLAFVIGAPELIASEFLPVIGEISDIGAIIIAALVVVHTARAVKRYR